jgi:hypothetical protein
MGQDLGVAAIARVLLTSCSQAARPCHIYTTRKVITGATALRAVVFLKITAGAVTMVSKTRMCLCTRIGTSMAITSTHMSLFHSETLPLSTALDPLLCRLAICRTMSRPIIRDTRTTHTRALT